jgi:hypothetical protein
MAVNSDVPMSSVAGDSMPVEQMSPGAVAGGCVTPGVLMSPVSPGV